ncbi:MAG: site-specific DNA-methyltransferase [Planctomycetaceae bacterium]|nr:MAG: site-specific DNA-methyltransferase [Planctomycetaceae bacterium]
MLFRGAAEIANDDSLEVGQSVVDWAMSRELCVVAFCSPWKQWAGNWRNWLAWDKGGHVGIGGDRATCWKRTWEMIGVTHNPPLNGGRDEGVLRFNAVSPPPSGHAAEKPIPLMEYLIEKVSSRDDVIFEPFAGSGSTVVAAITTGRQCIACEIDENWCLYVADRCDRELDQKRLPFDEPKRVETQGSLFD